MNINKLRGGLLSSLFTWAVFSIFPLQGHAALSDPETTYSSLVPENATTNIFVPNPGVVTISFMSTDETSALAQAGDADEGTYYYLFAGDAALHSGAQNLSVTNPAGLQVAYLNLNNTGHAAAVAVSISALGSSLSLSGTWADEGDNATVSYSISGSSSSNVALSGNGVVTFTGTSYNPVTSADIQLDTGGTADNALLTYSGAFTFYAATPGTYIINETAPGSYSYGTNNASPSYDFQNGWVSAILVQSITVPVVQLPTGAISVNQNSEGANGVTLSWKVTPPASQ